MLLPVVLAMAVGSPLAGRMLDKVGSKIVVITGTAIATVGMALLGLWANNLIIYYVAAILMGLGLSALLGAPLRYIFLTEARETERAAAQGVVTLFTSVGQVTSAALVGAVAASLGGGVAGYQAAFLTIAVVSLGLSIISLGLKSHSEELETAQRHGPPQTEPAG
jgi:MFS family permease